MPAGLSASDKRLMWAGAAVMVLMVTVAAILATDPESSGEDASTYSAAAGGAKAIYLLLGDLGYHVSRWQQSPAELDDAAHTTLILAEPADPTDSERAAIAAFLDAGGRVIATGLSGARFFGANPPPDPLRARRVEPAKAVSPSALARVAPSIMMAAEGRWDSSVPAIDLYARDDAAVVLAPVREKGEALWWAGATPFTNLGVRDADNLSFVLASIGPRDERRVLFDEYFHGDRPTVGGLLWHSPAKWLLVQLALLGLVAVFTFSRRSGPLLSPAPEWRLSPLEFVRTLGSLYRRANATSIPVDAAARRWRVRLSRRLGVPPTAPIDRLDMAARQRWGEPGGDAVAALAACERAREAAEPIDVATAVSLVGAADRAAAPLVGRS